MACYVDSFTFFFFTFIPSLSGGNEECPGQDLNRVSLKYESRAMPLRHPTGVLGLDIGHALTILGTRVKPNPAYFIRKVNISLLSDRLQEDTAETPCSVYVTVFYREHRTDLGTRVGRGGGGWI
jgi:hypothetical protein